MHVGPNRGAEHAANATLNGQPDMELGVGTRWQWQPGGLSFRALPLGVQPAGRGAVDLAPRAVRQSAAHRAERKIQATADMATLRGLVQARAGNLSAAETASHVALAVDPTHGPSSGTPGAVAGEMKRSAIRRQPAYHGSLVSKSQGIPVVTGCPTSPHSTWWATVPSQFSVPMMAGVAGVTDR